MLLRMEGPSMLVECMHIRVFEPAVDITNVTLVLDNEVQFIVLRSSDIVFI